MKKLILLVILAFSMVLSPLATTFAATPKVINYQGQLESDAITSKAPVLVVFELFEDAAGGSALWIEQKSVTVDKNGFFSVYLGDVNPIDLKFDKQYFVQVTVGNNQPFPRTKLSSTPSAFYAADADTALYAFDAGMAMDVAPKAIGLDNLADEVLTAGGDLMGMYPNPQIKPSAIIDNIPDGSITSEMLSPGISTSPSGPAGGDLFGTYPDPLIAVGAVKTDRIFDGAVTEQKIADGAVTNNKIVSLDAAKLTNVPALNYQVAHATDATIDGDGTLALPLGLADNAVSTAKIVDGAVTNAKVGADAITTDKIMNETILAEDIAAGAVTTSEILDETILAEDIATGAVTTSEILNETILAEDIATGAVTTSEILNETILAEDIATGAVTTSEILNSTILTEDLSDNAVTQAKLANDAVRVRNIDVNGAAPVNGDVLYFDGVDNEMRWGQEKVETSAPLTGDGTTATPVTLDPTYGSADELLIRTAPSGWVSSKINTANINDAAITNAKLADNSVTTAKIMDGQVMTADLMDLGVTTGKLADMGVTTAKIADGNVTTIKIADNAITSAKILDGDVQTADLANNSVTTAKILDGEVMTGDLMDLGVTTAKLDDAAVTTAKLADNSVNGDKVINGSLSSLDLDATGVTAGIYGDPSANPNEIQVPEYKVDAQGRILTSVENTYTVILAATIFDESPASDITVDGTYDNLDLQIKAGVVGNTELADNSVTSTKIADGTIVTADLADNSVTSAKIIDGQVMTADIADAAVTTIKIADANVTTAKIADANVTTAKIADLNVTTAKIADMSVTTNKIADANVTTIKIADNAITTAKILDGDVQTADLADGSVTSAKILDGGIATVDYGANTVLNTKIGSGVQVAGKVLKADGAGNTVWGDDLGLSLPYTGSYPGPGNAFTITHTGAAGAGSAAVFTSSTSTNTSHAVVINKGVDAGAGSALSVSGTGVQGTNYIARFNNSNLNEGRTVLIENEAPATNVTNPDGIANNGDEFVTPDPTDANEDAALVVRNRDGANSNQKLAIKTYGSIQANSTIQGANLVAYNGQITLYNSTTGAVATLMPPTNVGDPLNVTPALDINGTSTVLGLNNIWESADGNLFPAGTGTDRDVPTALAVSNSIGSIAGEPFITFQADGGGLTNNRVFAVNSTLTSTVAGADNGNVDLSINLANPNTWTGTQTLSAAGNGLVVTTNSDIQGNVANSVGAAVTVADDLVVTGTSTLQQTATIGGAALAAPAVVADNNSLGTPTAIITNANVGGTSINASGTVTINNGGLNVTGATDLNTGLNVDGASTLDAVTIAGILSQSGGQVTLNGNVDATSGLDVTGATTLAGTVSQTGGGQITLSGNVDANSGLDVVGAATVAGTVTQTGGAQVSLSGNVDAANGLDVTGGNLTLPVSGGAVDVNEIVTVVNNTNTNDQLPTALAAYTAINNVASAEFFTLSNSASLNNERALQFNAGNFTTVDGGANSNFTVDLSDNIVGGSFGNNTGTSYSTFTVDNKGRLTAAATEAIVVDDAAASDITIGAAASNNLDLQIKADVVTSNELDETDGYAFTGLVSFTNIDVNGGAVDGAIIGANNSAAGTFTNLTAQTQFTLNGTDFAGNTSVDDIYTSVHFGGGPLITGDDDDLITAGAVAAALAATDLQVAYNNGSDIVTAGADAIDFTLTSGAFNVNTTAGNNFNVNGPGIADFGANVNANNGLDVIGANLTVGGANFTVTPAGVVNGVSATFTGNVEGGTITEGGNAVPNVTEAPAAGDISGTYAAGFQIVANAVTPAEVAPGNYDTDLTAGSYVLGNLDGTAIGATAHTTGKFTTLEATSTVTAGGLVSANAGLTIGAAQNFTLGGVSVDGIQTTAPLASDATDLVTEKAVFDALAAHTLQTAYVNGNTITTSAGEGKVVIAGDQNLDVRTQIENTTGDITMNGNVVPNATNTRTLGTNANRWNDLYLNGASLHVGTTVGTEAMLGYAAGTASLNVDGTNTVQATSAGATVNGTLTQTTAGQVTFAGNVDANNGLDVTGGLGLNVGAGNFLVSNAGAVTQVGGAQVSFSGNIDAAAGIDVTGGALTVTSGGAVISGGAVVNGGINVNGTANLNNAVNVLGTLTAGIVDINGGAGSAIDNTIIGGTTPLAGTFTALTASSLGLTGDLNMNGNNINNVAALSNAGGTEVTLNDDVIVTGTSDLRGAVSNTTATSVSVNDGLNVSLTGTDEFVNISSSARNGAVFAVTKSGGDNQYAATISGVERGASITTSGNAISGNIGLNVSATSGTDSRGIIATNDGTGTNASIVLNNVEGSSNAYAVSVTEGHLKPSADGATALLATNGTITVASNTVIRINTANAFAGTITLSAGTQVGQIIIVTNEDLGDIQITAGALGTPTIAAQTAAQFVWNGAAWVVMN